MNKKTRKTLKTLVSALCELQAGSSPVASPERGEAERALYEGIQRIMAEFNTPEISASDAWLHEPVYDARGQHVATAISKEP